MKTDSVPEGGTAGRVPNAQVSETKQWFDLNASTESEEDETNVVFLAPTAGRVTNAGEASHGKECFDLNALLSDSEEDEAQEQRAGSVHVNDDDAAQHARAPTKSEVSVVSTAEEQGMTTPKKKEDKAEPLQPPGAPRVKRPRAFRSDASEAPRALLFPTLRVTRRRHAASHSE